MCYNKKVLMGIGGLLAVGLIYFNFDPANCKFFPQCPFLLLTGLRCPGCGSQRAIHSLLHLDIIMAFKYNALLVISLPVIFILLYSEIYRTKKPKFYRWIHNTNIIWTYFSIVIIWWVFRNFLKL